MDFLCTNHYLPFIPFSDFLFTHVRISSAPTTICHSFNSWISSLLIFGFLLRQPLMVIHSILGCLVSFGFPLYKSLFAVHPVDFFFPLSSYSYFNYISHYLPITDHFDFLFHYFLSSIQLLFCLKSLFWISFSSDLDFIVL